MKASRFLKFQVGTVMVTIQADGSYIHPLIYDRQPSIKDLVINFNDLGIILS